MGMHRPSEMPVLVWSDASLLGAGVLVRNSGVDSHFRYIQTVFPKTGEDIALLELEAVTMAFKSFGKEWRDKRVTFYVGSSVVLGYLCNGYNRKHSDLGPKMNTHIQ